MQLRNNLYIVTDRTVDGLSARYTLQLQPSCFIYQAHFPGEPITPGVCIVQIGKELVDDLLQAKGMSGQTEIVKVKNVKFLSVLSPETTTSVVYDIKKVEVSEDKREIKVQIVVTDSEEAKAKISLVLKVIDAE